MDPRFFPEPCFHDPLALCLGHKRKDKNLVHDLPHGHRTRLIRGINVVRITRYLTAGHECLFSWEHIQPVTLLDHT